MKRSRFACFLVVLLLATANLSAQSSVTQGPAAGASVQKPFPLADLKNWQRVPNGESDVTITNITPGPIQFGDIIVQGKPQLTISLVLGKSEELQDPVSGDRVRRHRFMNTNEFVLFAWEHPAGSAPTYVLLQENGTLVTGSNFWVESLNFDERWSLTDLKVVLEAPDGSVLASRVIKRVSEAPSASQDK